MLTVVMDGVHDVGGMLGFGPVEREPGEAVFHHPWEGRVFGMAAGSMMAGCLVRRRSVMPSSGWMRCTI